MEARGAIMNLHKTKIDWATHSWNPVTGCLHGCDYCYARRLVTRFQPHTCERPMETGTQSSEGGATGITAEAGAPGCYTVSRPTKLADETGEYIRSTPYPKGFAPTLHAYTMDFPKKRIIPSRVFVSSMGDLFGEWVPDRWIENIFRACAETPRHDYLFLTKNPQRYAALEKAGKLPDARNLWYGATAANAAQMEKAADAIGELPWKYNTFLSLEPLTEDITASAGWTYANEGAYAKWIIVGAMTGGSSRSQQPQREWIDKIVNAAHAKGVPVFMKSSLATIWGEPLLHEHPKGMLWPEEEKSNG
ncbi:MAG: DUF5131 family protein [Bacteroides sp.]